MSKSRILKRALIIMGACLTLAWAGAIYAAEEQTASSAGTSSEGADLSLIKSDAEGVIVELRSTSFEIGESSVNGTAYHVLAIPEGGQMDDVGKPQLPVRGTLLGIPAEAEYSLRVIEVEQQTVPGRYNISPALRAVAERDAEGNPAQMSYVPARDDGVYSSNAFYPSRVAEAGSSGLIRDQRVLQLRFFPFQYNPVSGELRHYTRIRVEVRFSYPGGQPPLSAASASDESFDGILEKGLLNYDSARQWRASSSSREAEIALALGQGEAGYKVLVDEDGIFQLTYTALVSAGMDLGSVHPGDFELHNQGQEVAIRVVDEDEDGEFEEEDYILFYGEQMTTTYTYTNVYWLGTGTGDGLRMPEKDGTLGASTVLTYFNTTYHWEPDAHYNSVVPEPAEIPSEEEADHWFAGPPAVAGGTSTRDFTVAIDNLAVSPSYPATLRGELNGQDYVDDEYEHHAEVYLNSQLVYDGQWKGQTPQEFETDISSTLLLDGNNTVRLQAFLTAPEVAEYDWVYVNWIEIDYRRTYTAQNGLLFFDGDGGGAWRYEVPEFLTNTLEVFDVTDPLSVTHFVSTTVEGSGSYTLTFQDSISEEHHYLALSADRLRTPVVVEDSPSDLKSTSNGADYIIVTHPNFEDAVLPLVDHRAAQGLRVEVVDVQDVYDEFSYGVFNPGAIKEFLKHAYENWEPPAPSYVLLVGDGNYDFKNHEGKGEPNYIPPYLIYADEWIGETAAENRFVCVSGDDALPDMHIGRLPAQTASQVTTMVSKTIDYETNLPAGDWRQQVFFLADDPDNPEDPNTPNHFWSLSDDIADHHLPPAPLYTAEKVYYGIAPYTTIDAASTALRTAFGSGKLFINYVGHAALPMWGGGYAEAFLRQTGVASLPSTEKTPIVMAMSCNEGHFIRPNTAGSETWSCVAETLVRVQGRGSVANWSPTSFGTSSAQHYLHEGFYDAVFRDGVNEMGPATYMGKLNLYQNTAAEHWRLLDTYMVFGDPALQMPIERTYMAFVPLSLKVY